MTIDELITTAQQCVVKINEEDADNFYQIDTYANVARACAATAQAMLLAQMTDTIERPGMPDRRVLNVDTGN